MRTFRKLPYRLTSLVIALSLSACGNNPAVTPLASPTASLSPTPSPTVTGTPSVSPSTASPQPEKSDTSRTIQTKLTSLFASATGTNLESINCPSTVDLKVGNRFDCEAVADGQSFAIAVELTDTMGPQFTWSTRGVLQLAKLEQFIQEQVKAKGGAPVTANCGGTIRVAAPGESFSCQVTVAQGASRTAKVTVKDERGGVEVSL